MYKNQPDKNNLYDCCININNYLTISGGIYSGLPQKLFVVYSFSRSNFDKPKSVSYMCPLKSISIFSG